MQNIKISGIIGHHIDLTMKNNLFALNIKDDFLKPFIKKNEEGGYIGLGKLLDALVSLSYYTDDAKVKSLKKLIIDSIKENQLENGYIGTHKKDYRLTELWDIHETSYLIYALVQDYRYFNNKSSLKIAIKAMDYILKNLNEDIIKKIYSFKSGKTKVCIELGTIGFEGALVALYKASDDSCYLEYAKKIFKLSDWDREIKLGRHQEITGHAYAYFCRCLAQLEIYQIEPDKKWLKQTEKVLDFLLKKGGLVVSGSCGVDECWDNSQKTSGNIGETCATAYLIFLLDKLLQVEYNVKYGNLMERSIYNALFAAQSEDGRSIRYYVPISGKRTYFEKDTYCCPNNYRRIIFKLYRMVYYHFENTIFVNLYTQSKAQVNLTSGNIVKIEQKTDYPYSGKIEIKLKALKKETFSVSLRVPAWCKAFNLYVNDNKMSLKDEDGIISIKRLWSTGDKISLNLEMPCQQLKGFFEQKGKVAIMRGPTLFTLNLNLNKNLKEKDIQNITIIANKEPKIIKLNNLTTTKDFICQVETEKHGEIFLTQFTDPSGVESYFKVQNTSNAESDELLDHQSLENLSYTIYSNSTYWGGQ